MALEWIEGDKINCKVLRPHLTAKDATSKPMATPSNWLIDFNELPLEEAEAYRLPFAHLKATVQPERLANKNTDLHSHWWLHWRPRPALRKAIGLSQEMIAMPRHSKWVVPVKASTRCLANSSLTVICSEDDYIYGILSSRIHRVWIHAQKSTLEDRTRYTPSSCFETFPFPQQVTAQQAEAIRQQMIDLNDYRNAWMVETQKGITELYNRYFDEPASKLRKLHDALDALVLKAYGWSAKDDVLANLLDLNRELAELEGEGQAVVGPWDPNRRGQQ